MEKGRLSDKSGIAAERGEDCAVFHTEHGLATNVMMQGAVLFHTEPGFIGFTRFNPVGNIQVESI